MNWDEIAIGFLLGFLASLSLALGIHEIGRDDCEMHLPRTQGCKKVWQPKQESSKQQSKHGE